MPARSMCCSIMRVVSSIRDSAPSMGTNPISRSNHLAPFLLTNLLHDSLAAADGALVLNTASIGNLFGRVDALRSRLPAAACAFRMARLRVEQADEHHVHPRGGAALVCRRNRARQMDPRSGGVEFRPGLACRRPAVPDPVAPYRDDHCRTGRRTASSSWPVAAPTRRSTVSTSTGSGREAPSHRKRTTTVSSMNCGLPQADLVGVG